MLGEPGQGRGPGQPAHQTRPHVDVRRRLAAVRGEAQVPRDEPAPQPLGGAVQRGQVGQRTVQGRGLSGQHVGVDRGEVVTGEPVPPLEQRLDAPGPPGGCEVPPDPLEVVVHPVVGGGEVAVRRHVVRRQPHPAGPAVRRVPGRDGLVPVPVVTLGHPSHHPLADHARPVRDEKVVDRLDPVIERRLDVGDAARAQQRHQRVEPEVPERGRRRPQAVRRLPRRALDDPPGRRLDDLDRLGVVTGHADGLQSRRRRHPAVRGAREHLAGPPLELLDEHVLVVGSGVGDAPRHVAGVGEVLHARDAGEGEAGDVERVVGVGARQPHLLVAVGELEARGAGRRRSSGTRSPSAALRPPRSCCRARAPRAGRARRRPRPRSCAGAGATACRGTCRTARGGRRRRPAASSPATVPPGGRPPRARHRRARPRGRRSPPRRTPRRRRATRVPGRRTPAARRRRRRRGGRSGPTAERRSRRPRPSGPPP